jgi:hypothetical protein
VTASEDSTDKAHFQPSGREPELPSADESRAPMLGGGRRLWPSIAAYLLSEQYKAHRAWDMKRVWIMRRLRYRLQQRLEKEREASLDSGVPVRAISEEEAFAEISAERAEVQEALDEALALRHYNHVNEQRSVAVILDEVITFWQARIGAGALDTNE